MRRFLNIRPAGAGGQPRVRRVALVLLTLLAVASSLASPLTAQASLNDDLKNLPDDASPKEACHLLVKDGAIKASQETLCRKLIADGFEGAKKKSNDGSKTIAAAAICTIEALHQKIKNSEVADCSESVADTLSMDSGGFDPVGAVGGFIGGAVDAVGGAIGGAINDTILAGFKAIISLLFGGLQSAITVALVKWMTTIPNLSTGHVGGLERSVAVGAGGLLAATMTISIVRFWGSGLTGNGAWAGAEGVLRGAVAAVLIGTWPQIFGLALKASNALHAGILNGAVEAQLKDLFRDLDVIGLGGGLLVGGAVPMILAIIIAVVGMVMLLGLVAMKIVITALTIVLFCSMPLAFVLWPIPELAGVTRFCVSTLGAALAIPVVWCLVFGAFAAIGADTFSFSNTGKEEGILGTALNAAIIRPLVAIALLYLALVLPRRLLQVVPFFHSRPGAIRHIGTGMAVRAGFNAATPLGNMALGRAQAMGGPIGSLAGRFGGGGAGGAAAGAAAGAGGPREATAGSGRGEPTAKGNNYGQSGGPARAERGSQPPKAKPAGMEGKASGQTAGQAGGAQRSEHGPRGAGGQKSSGAKSGYAAMSDQQHAKAMEREPENFGGPRMMKPTQQRNDQIKERAGTMLADSGSGSAVSRQQVDGASSSLSSRPDLLEAARRASYDGKPDQAAGAFAEWSLTDNQHVSDQHRSAFSVLGSASPSQRKTALGEPGSPVRPSSGPGQAANGGSGGGRRVPPVEFKTAEPPPRRTPHAQPSSKGSG